MERIYINADEVRITKTSPTTVDVEFYTGQVLRSLEPRRLFPMTGLEKYISLLDAGKTEVAVIRSLAWLMPESAQAVRECLDEYYFIPKILKIKNRTEKYGIMIWSIVTDHGPRTINIRSSISDIRVLYDGRVLIRDVNDNRYEISDVKKLDRESRGWLKYDM